MQRYIAYARLDVKPPLLLHQFLLLKSREKGPAINCHHQLTFYRCVNMLGTSTCMRSGRWRGRGDAIRSQDWLYHASASSTAKRRLWFIVGNKKPARKFLCTVHTTYQHEKNCGGCILHVLYYPFRNFNVKLGVGQNFTISALEYKRVGRLSM